MDSSLKTKHSRHKVHDYSYINKLIKMKSKAFCSSNDIIDADLLQNEMPSLHLVSTMQLVNGDLAL